MNMIYLKSVGSLIDPNTANIYPAFDNGKSDLKNPISLLDDEVSIDWWNSLNNKDYKITTIIKNKLTK